MPFCVRDLRKIIDGLDDNMPVVLDVLYDECYVLSDISVYTDENIPPELVIEGGFSHDVCISVDGGYGRIKNVFVEYFEGVSNNSTPIVYDYDKIYFGDEVLLLEKSTNEKMELYGVVSLVYDLRSKEVQRIDLCKWFDSSCGLLDFIRGIDGDVFGSARRFGEVKVIGK